MASKTQAEKIAALLKDIDIAMLTTVGAGGFLMSRPLSTRHASFDGSKAWFFTEADSPKVAEIRKNPKVNLAYASEKRNTYVSLTGTAAVSRDREMMDALWSDAAKAFFPKGKDDPNLVLLEVTLRSAEYWDGPATAIGKLVTFVVARLTKNEEVMGENRIVDLRGDGRKRLPPSHARARKGAKAAVKRVVTGTPAKKSAAKKTAKKAAKKAGSSTTTRKQPGRKSAARK